MDRPTDRLTDWLMPSDKHNLILAKVTGLISSLLNVASSGDVPFCHPSSSIACIMVLLKFTFVLLWTPFLYPLLRRWRFAVLILWLRCETRVSAVLAGHFLHYSLLGMLPNMFKKLEAKRSTAWLSDTPTFKSINGVRALTIEHSVFSVMVGLILEILFRLFSIYNTALWAENE